ncbi:hypothetical protein GCM10023194_81520 [Planotetraspora phitsanulokensis]|uniref:Uncharacterized protein n=1 Tax=Planotetraspora phitsanulokensis TaxID=575192 RepID=A0A8J3UFS0_9ACTN|nr:hypothetical protein [Planotetraspora phitsanulokensis]GII42882.1 hypothetical protein Pph01_78850 [Planotetraspora phitsanulokensis]
MRKPATTTSRHTHAIISTNAKLTGWTATADRSDDSNTYDLALTRDDWRIVVGFNGHDAFAAAVQYPGQASPAGVLPLGLLSIYLRGNREQMSAFRLGQRVVCGDKAGIVTDIVPVDDKIVRLVVSYDDGSTGEPYTTLVHAEAEVAA